LISEHGVDLIAEESTDMTTTYVETLVLQGGFPGVTWINVDATPIERSGWHDENPEGRGTLVDFEFTMKRERVWVEKTTKATKESALLICACTHSMSSAVKFHEAGFRVTTHGYLDPTDAPEPRDVV
jgi:hypothetical protein